MKAIDLKFESVSEMIDWLIKNEGKELFDFYGRRWKYENYSFYYSDLLDKEYEKDKLECLHLFKTDFQSIN